MSRLHTSRSSIRKCRSFPPRNLKANHYHLRLGRNRQHLSHNRIQRLPARDTWAWEVASMTLSLISMAAIVILLVKYDGRAFPSVPGDISLNAIVATLSTISKTSLIFSVSAVLGQLKWDWCEQQPRPLEDLDTFDQASRGPLGATKLLLGGTARSVASIGAVIMILALALDPFVQQVVGTAQEESYISSDDVWIERQTTPSYYPQYYADHDSEYLDMLNGAFWNDAAVYNRPAHCPSGNCRFESFDTLEFCVDSEIITDFDSLRLKNCSPEWDREEFATMTEAYTINFPKSTIGWMVDFEGDTLPQWNLSNSRLKVRNVLARMGSARVHIPPRTPDFRNIKVEWVETAFLTLCQTTRTVTVTNGVTTSVITNQTFGEVYKDDSVHLGLPTENGYQYPAECWSAVADGSRRSPDKSRPVINTPGGINITVDPTTMNFCASYLPWGGDMWRRIISFYKATKTIYRPQGAPANDGWRLATDLGDGRVNARLMDQPSFYTSYFAAEDTHKRVQTHTLGAVFRSVAAALNNFTLARSTEEPVRGSVRLVVTIIKVRWPWLVLPLVVEALGLGLLVLATVFSKRRVAGLWKDSLLAVLYHGLDREDGRLHGESARTMTDMKMMARGTRLGLVAKTTTGGRKIVLSSK
ncbi:hypothetical protein B0T18DRAFT_446428 [Schizothecium vesticola]|uniref:Uncharacterized protein n=1 Tax=Schizothecium vesticola TaxID=314040 RepID=A0AA40EUM3_9PEZI|nr:hypothetical protein B0T18DRAFT_446428 [Schizothecium vesticola]